MKWNNIRSSIGWLLVTVFILGLASAEMYNYTTESRPLAFVRRYKPSVSIFPKNISAQKGEPLYSGDTLATNENGYAAVQFMDKSFAKVKPNSELIVRGEVRNDKSTSTRIALEAGEIFMEITQQQGNNYEVATTKSVASVKGTQFGMRSTDYTWVEEGIVEVVATISGNTVTLTENMFAQVNDDNTITTGELTNEEVQELREEYENLEAEANEPQRMRLRFRDENGQIREIEVEYQENNGSN